MKKLLIVLALLAIIFSLGACGKNEGENGKGEEYEVEEIYSEHEDVKKFAKYLVAAEADEDEDLEYSYYNYEDNDYYLYLDSYSETLYYRAYLSVYEAEDSTKALYIDSDHYILIRPYDYVVMHAQLNKKPEYYALNKVEAYTLNYENDLDYDWYYDEEDDTEILCIDVVYDGTLNDDLVGRIAKKEYVINVLTDMWEDVYYFLDVNTIEYNENNIPVYTNAQYKAVLDYEKGTVQLFKDDVELKTITVD